MIKSYLFVPANHEKKLTKAINSSADGIIFDLEDAIPTREKVVARNILRDFLTSGQPRKYQIIRTNPIHDDHFYEDLHLALDVRADCIMLPKVESAHDINETVSLMAKYEQKHGVTVSTNLIPLIETAAGVQSALSILKASNKVKRIAFGAIDFAKDLQIQKPHPALLHIVRAQLSLYSRQANKEKPIDTVFIHIEDTDGLTEEAELAKGLGFFGKMVIHPKQIEYVNQVFSESGLDVQLAKQIVIEYEKALEKGIGAIQVNGMMVDVPVYEKAKHLLTLHSS